MRTLLIPPVFLAVYASILFTLTWLAAPGSRPGPAWAMACPVDVMAAPQRSQASVPSTPGHGSAEEELLEELSR